MPKFCPNFIIFALLIKFFFVVVLTSNADHTQSVGCNFGDFVVASLFITNR